MKPRSKKTIDAIDFMRSNPDVPVKAVSKRFKITLTYTYKLLKEARKLGPILPVEKTPVPVPVPKETPTFSAEPLLTDRGHRYGHFVTNAALSQALKNVLTDHAADTNKRMPDYMWESLDHICTKIARVMNGDSFHLDSWYDISGYAVLVAEEIENANREAIAKSNPDSSINY